MNAGDGEANVTVAERRCSFPWRVVCAVFSILNGRNRTDMHNGMVFTSV